MSTNENSGLHDSIVSGPDSAKNLQNSVLTFEENKNLATEEDDSYSQSSKTVKDLSKKKRKSKRPNQPLSPRTDQSYYYDMD